jgi:hypothetical protein
MFNPPALLIMVAEQVRQERIDEAARWHLAHAVAHEAPRPPSRFRKRLHRDSRVEACELAEQVR